MTPAQRAVLSHPAFANRVDCGPHPKGCWLWTAGGAQGYGRVRWDGKTWWAHRLSRFIGYGDLPEAICHTCDVKACVKPEHCRAGTQVENAQEMWERGLGALALTPDQVALVRARFKGGRKAADQLAVEVGCSSRTIYRVFDGGVRAYRQPESAAA